MTPVTATNRHGESFVHEFSIVTSPTGLAPWLQCSCTEQCPTEELAEAHLDAARSWQAHEETMR